MARQRTIIGLGESLLREHPDRTEPAGLASEVAIGAVRLGHLGVAVSRVGQDPPARELDDLLRDAGVDTSHLQSDPDLPTGREIVRAIGGSASRYLEERAAFDNLQFDFDLEDVAQQADAVVYGLLSRRSGQTRSEENRFLDACRAAVKVFDLTNRAGDAVDRGQARSGLDPADGAIADDVVLRDVVPGAGGASPLATARTLLREFSLSFVVVVYEEEGDRRLGLVSEDETLEGTTFEGGHATIVFAVLALLDGVLRGKALPEALQTAARAAAHHAQHPDEPLPPDLLQ